jgi:hypothetical protein
LHVLAGEQRAPIEPDGLGDVGSDEAVVASDDLDTNAEPGQIGECGGDLGLDWIEKQQEARKGHVLLVSAVVAFARRAILQRQPEHAEPLASSLREEPVEPVARVRVERDGFTALEQQAATVAHMRVGAFGDDAMLGRALRLGDRDGQAAALEIVGNLVDFAIAAD